MEVSHSFVFDFNSVFFFWGGAGGKGEGIDDGPGRCECLSSILTSPSGLLKHQFDLTIDGLTIVGFLIIIIGRDPDRL